MSTVGVVIPAFNPRPGHLLRAVDSVRSQSFADWACVVVDDGSAPPISSAIGSAGDGIRVVAQRNQGVAAARNLGASVVDGEYLAFLDQDDEWAPTKLERQIAYMRQHGLVMCDTEFEFVRDGVGQGGPGFEYHNGDFLRLLSSARMGLSTLIVHRDTFGDMGGFDEALNVATDWDLQLRFAAAGLRFDRLHDALTRIHLHGANASSDYRLMYREQMTILRRYASDADPEVRQAARRGRENVRDLHVYHAIERFRSTRAPSHLLWAAQRRPRIVAGAVLAKVWKLRGTYLG